MSESAISRENRSSTFHGSGIADRSGIGKDGSEISRTRAPRSKKKAGRAAKPSPSLRHVARLSYGERKTGNALIHGENLAALGALQDCLRGQVRCVYIDPPYNNQERYRHYMDAESHDEWLDGITRRIEALKPLLSPEGSLWISIDDREVHYLKVAADRIMGRRNFVTTVIWQQRTTRENRKTFSNNHEYLLVYAADPRVFRKARNLLPPDPALLSRYKNPDSDPRGPWQSVSANVQDGHATASQYYDLVAPNGSVHHPPEGRCWIYTREKMQVEIAAGNLWFGKKGDGVPRIKRFLNGSMVGLTPETLWRAEDVGTNDQAKKHLIRLFPREPVFDTPKPESLISRIFQIATRPGDLVADAFLGSGTTAAVAHKLNRRYVGIERGLQAVTHCAARLRMVVDGDRSGISIAAGWTGGGGFDFFRVRE